MKYRKKPVVIDAVVWTGFNTSEIDAFCGPSAEFVKRWNPSGGMTPENELRIHTLEGDHIASRGDYIIKGVQGEFYPCKPDIFEKTYEPAE